MIGVEDLATLVVQLLREGPAGTHTWIVADGQPYTARSLYDCLREALGRRSGAGWLPAAGWRVACVVWDRLRGARGDSTGEKLFGSELYDNGAVIRDTGWRPRQVLADLAPRIVERP